MGILINNEMKPCKYIIDMNKLLSNIHLLLLIYNDKKIFYLFSISNITNVYSKISLSIMLLLFLKKCDYILPCIAI